jgi:hypothetical protein
MGIGTGISLLMERSAMVRLAKVRSAKKRSAKGRLANGAVGGFGWGDIKKGAMFSRLFYAWMILFIR